MDNRIKLFPDKNKKNKNKKDTHQKIRRKKNTNPSYIDIIHHLHQTVGNQEVQRMFETGEIQAKLKISNPIDEYEREAERLAQEVLSNFTSDEEEKIKIKKKTSVTSSNKGIYSSKVDSNIKGLKGRGTPLQQSLLQFFEERFGYDFRDVRIHTDTKSAELADTINAKAFTHGNDIVFAEGQYQPATTEGKKLIAHELTHTVQQGEGFNDVVQMKGNDDEKSMMDKAFSKGVKGVAWLLEKTPNAKFCPIPGLDFMANFMKGMMIGSLYRLSEEDLDNLFNIGKNIVKAVYSPQFMKEYLLGFIKGFLDDIIMIYEIPGTIKQIANFIKQVVGTIQGISKEDIKNFMIRIDDITDKLLEGGKEYLTKIADDLKRGIISDDLKELLKIFMNVPQSVGKGVGGCLTEVLIKYFSKDYKKLGKDLGKIMGVLSGIAAFQALIIAITAGGGSIWTGIRTGLASVKKILLDGVSKAIKIIGKVLSKIKKLLGTIKNSIKGLFKGIGKGTKNLFKGMKGKLDDILESITKLIDDILKKIGLKVPKKSGNVLEKAGTKETANSIKKLIKDDTISKFKKFLSPEDAEKWADEIFNEWFDTLSKAEKKAIKKYTEKNYGNINDVLRGKAKEFVGNNEKYVNALNRVFAKSEGIPDAITVYRGADKAMLGNLKDIKVDKLVGKVIEEKGFMSTSLIKDKAFGGNLLLEINAPKGAKGISVAKFSKFDEAEILFDKGQILMIKKAIQENNCLKLICEIIL